MPQKSSKNIYVTQPSLAPLEEYTGLLTDVWASGILTHNGPKVRELEKLLSEKLAVPHLISVTNGTIAIQLAIRALGLKGEIITTPFTWVATASAITWEGCTPVFVDINPATFNIDPRKIERAITKKTVAILPVHVFGNPCDITAIEKIAKKHKLKVIYDAAHALFVNYKGRSIMRYGDISATSFHATKIFNTGEGGACITDDGALFNRLKRLRFFGHNEEKEIVDDGLNGKMTELHAALGLANLRYADRVLEKRKKIYELYRTELGRLVGWQKFDPKSYNYSYMPVLFKDEKELLRVEKALNAQNIFPRRYFYPSLNTVPLFNSGRMPVSENIASRVLCLPSYHGLTGKEQKKIAGIIKKVVHGA